MNIGAHDSFSIAMKQIGTEKSHTRLLITIYMCISDEEFSIMLRYFQDLFDNVAALQKKYCVILHVHQDVTIAPLQIASLICTLSMNRHITEQFSVTTAIVVPSARVTNLLNTMFAMYKPVRHIELSKELKSAKEHCKARVIDDENKLFQN